MRTVLGGATSLQKWSELTSEERKRLIQRVVRETESEGELRNILLKIMGTDTFTIVWNRLKLGDKDDRESRTLARNLGNLVSKSDALVMIITSNELFS